MRTITFEVTSQNGSIKIPRKFGVPLGRRCKVIIFYEEENFQKEKKFTRIPSGIKKPVFVIKFSISKREELHDR